jgi:hypothetical protein
MVKIKNKEVIADLTRLTELCLKPTESAQSLPESSAMVSIWEEEGVFLNEEETGLFHKIIAALLAEQLSEHVSEKFLQDSLWKYLHDVLKNSDEFRKNTSENVKKFLDTLSARPVYEWRVVFSLGALRSLFNLGPIGGVEFFTFTEANFGEWKVFGHTRLRERLTPYFVGKICAEIKVQAIDSDKAIVKAKFEVDTALNLIRSCYGVRGTRAAIEIVDPLNVLAKNLETGADDSRLSHDWSWGSTIEAKDREPLSNYILCFDPILKKTQKTKLDRRIVRSINWCGEATRDKNLEVFHCLGMSPRSRK